jgi:hypothetical protein
MGFFGPLTIAKMSLRTKSSTRNKHRGERRPKMDVLEGLQPLFFIAAELKRALKDKYQVKSSEHKAELAEFCEVNSERDKKWPDPGPDLCP